MTQLTVRLKPWQSRRLRQIRDHAASARQVKRAMCLLLSADEQEALTIARVTGLSLDAITDIRRRWQKRGLRSVADRPRSGRPPRVTTEYRRQLRQALRRGPLRLGYVFTVWSIARLGTYLQKRTGIALSLHGLRKVVRREGFVIGRPKHTLRGKRNERKYRRAQRRLKRLKRGRRKRTQPMNCGTPMPRSSTCCRIWSAAGCPKGGNWP